MGREAVLMKILLLGKNGQVGWELQRALAPLGELVAYDREQADLSNFDKLRLLIQTTKPDWIVNAAAYTAVDQAETDKQMAQLINADAVAVIAEEAKKIDAWLVHYSTDYVFDGKKEEKYIETDEVKPLSVYGKTKLNGELNIENSGCKYLIFRTSWVFAAKGANFAKSMLRLAAEREQLKIVADQFGAPTSAELIADVSAICIKDITASQYATDKVGIYHLVASGEASWHSYAKYIIEKAILYGQQLKVSTESVCPINTSDYPLPAARPQNSRLETRKLEKAFSVRLPEWKVYVDRLLEELILSGNSK